MRSRMIACIVLLWAAFCASLGMSSQDRVSSLVETKTGWRFEDDIEVFDGSVAPAPAPEMPKNFIWLLNSDFELIIVPTSNTVLASVTDTTLIPNWLPGGNGVQILQSSTYQMSSFSPSVFAIHLNNPAANSTQGSISTQNLTANPHPATLYTVQYDCARHPDGPLNLLPTLKISSMTGLTLNYYTLRMAKYNDTDTRKRITWTRQSFLFMGTGAQTSIKFESMSELYGPIIDNVVLLKGVHILHSDSAPTLGSTLPLWQRMCSIFTVVALMLTAHQKPYSS
ncbi:hypothetical protein M758_4G082200 [Ceratodon purpureus]|uniref:DUF642 domain-containing protein n=1 Tax=Ceratodon purpureus TaxID=3225 RepID=A0A8T0I9P4_CERPU|nr:hypothetical protein KC19_4G081300 [Ceratodon purpureus]KAG0618657.1 hypothetical protein M758_4G082200 [Ceratodon purpureus]